MKRKILDIDSEKNTKKIKINSKQSIKKEKKEIISAPIKLVAPIRKSEQPDVEARTDWINRERVLFVPSRGMTAKARYFMLDMMAMMPHAKKEAKIVCDSITELAELADEHNSTRIIFLESRHHVENFMWLINLPDGPSIRFQLENVTSSAECHFSGNALKSSRPVLCFSQEFSDQSSPLCALIAESLGQTFGTPNRHPRSQPFVDKMFQFSWLDHRVWFRCYQLVEDGAELAEIGPRFCLRPVLVLEKAFGGAVLFKAAKLFSNKVIQRRLVADKISQNYANKLLQKKIRECKPVMPQVEVDVTDTLFD